jgi:hypothetical protein
MILGDDDIRNLRAEAQKTFEYQPTTEGSRLLAMWVIAEQLFEIRASLGILIERTEKKERE